MAYLGWVFGWVSGWVWGFVFGLVTSLDFVIVARVGAIKKKIKENSLFAVRKLLFILAPYCNVTNAITLPVPESNGSKAFPTIAPMHFSLSSHFIAWPGIEEVVSKSPLLVLFLREQ